MKFYSRTYEQILADNPSCFAVPHASASDPSRCEPCSARRSCLEVSVQLLLAKKIGLLNGKIAADAQYSVEDEIRIGKYVMANATQKSAISPCNPTALPKLYDRAMLAYKNRQREPSHDEIMAELDLLCSVSESPAIAASSAAPAEAQQSTSLSIRSGSSSKTSLGAGASPVVFSSDNHAQRVQLDALDSIGPATVTQDPKRDLSAIPPTCGMSSSTASSMVACSVEAGTSLTKGEIRTHEIAHQELRAMTGAFHAAGMKGYLAIRERFVALHFETNKLGRWAPRFREIPAHLFADERGNAQLALDRQVIDLHWLWATKRGKRCGVKSYETLFATDEFDQASAVRFATEAWHWNTKAAYLNLTSNQQWELCALQTDPIRKRWVTIKAGDRVGAKIRQIGATQVDMILRNETRPQHQKHIQDQVATWVAVTIAKQRWTEAARLGALITGGPQRDPRQIERSFASVLGKIKKSKL
jgi:hypothetical protein